ncbi:MAG: hypothetical protein ACREBJ_02070 [Nitrosotalea sp.]
MIQKITVYLVDRTYSDICSHETTNSLFERHAVICAIPKTREMIPAEDASSLREKIDPEKIMTISNRICSTSDCLGVNLRENNRTMTFVSYLINSLNLMVLLISNKKNIAQNVKNERNSHQGNEIPIPSNISGANPSDVLIFFLIPV